MSLPLPALTILGHRGARGLAPENTLLGIETALRLGVDGVELDVQHHPEGPVYLLHDLTLDRTTNGRGWAAETPWSALERLDAGQGEGIPTLDAALDLIDRRGLVNLELKTWGGCAEAVAEVLARRLAAGWDAAQFLVSSFHLPELARFRARLPAVPVAALYCGVPLTGLADLEALGAQQAHLSAEFVDPAYTQAVRASGRRVWAYTVNEPECARRLAEAGVAGLFTDHPERFLKPMASPPLV